MRALWVVLALLLPGAAWAQIGQNGIGGGMPPGASGLGPANVLATGGTTARTLAAINADVANVLNFGADPTGAADSAPAINATIAATRNGSVANVYLPAGVYHVKTPLDLGTATQTQSQCIIGDGWGTIIDVSTDFSTTATGVIVLPSSVISPTVQFCVKGVHFHFHQPADSSATTTQASASGATTITVNVVPSNLAPGDIVVDITHGTALPLNYPYSGNGAETVQSISGNVITLTQAVLSAGVSSGDTIQFAKPRGSFTTLAQGCSLTAGAAGCKYPWAIYNPGSGQIDLDHLFSELAWDNIYQRGGTFHFSYIFNASLDQGLNIDNSHNFPQIDDYELWNFGNGASLTNSTDHQAIGQVYYDGSTVCANIGATDGLAASNFQCWTGALNLTSTFSWGAFTNLMMDGNFADMSIAAGSWLQINGFYTTGNPVAGSCKVNITGGKNNLFTNAYFSAQTLPHLCVSSGNTTLVNSTFTANAPDYSVVQQTGGSLAINNSFLGANTGAGTWLTAPLIAVSGSSAFFFGHNTFLNNAGNGNLAITVGTDGQLIHVSPDNNWFGWKVSGPTGTFASGPSGIYGDAPIFATRGVGTATDSMLVTDRTLRLNYNGGVAESIFGCGGANAGQTVVIEDAYGNAATNNDTVTPQGGTINGAASVQITTNHGAIRLTCDGVSNWMMN